MSLPKPPPDRLELRGQHVKLTTKDEELWGILQDIDSGWVYLEKLIYYLHNSSGVRHYECFMKPDSETTCMVAVSCVLTIEKLYNVRVKDGTN